MAEIDDRESEEVDIQPYEGAPAYDRPQAADGAQDDEGDDDA
jgi:hypothetical protein